MIYVGWRQLISALGDAAVAWPLAVRAQQGECMRRIGALMSTAEDDPESKARIAITAGIGQFGAIQTVAPLLFILKRP